MQQPNRHIIAFINYLVLVPLVYFIPKWMSPYLPEQMWLQVAANVAVIVVIISYLVMPLVIKLNLRFQPKA
ncbi:hypothetical protein MSG37_06815 [Shewanella sp. 1CM18E]|uniref:hypothetical protein n=1 Tax=Shewanella sp. 1CM18E TaxID=2929169 RepID=UPI0020C173E7|nr:hypothetical protein [Shewanella sp. 1CM18E]MCK8044590.1 hypothetical protein [Shewanella sp. 1CM18E]